MKACTPLWAAAAAGHLDIVELLIEQKVEVDGRVGTGSTPLRGAVCDRRIDIKIIWLRTEQMLTQGRMMRVHRCFQLATMITQISWNVFSSTAQMSISKTRTTIQPFTWPRDGVTLQFLINS